MIRKIIHTIKDAIKTNWMPPFEVRKGGNAGDHGLAKVIFTH